MKTLGRLLVLGKGYAWWMVFGLFASLVTLVANLGLMAVSGWFIASMAIAGATGAAINYFTPAALIRAFAMLRTGGRYVDRLATHEATFRILGGLRLWFFDHLEPLAPARLQLARGGDLLSRIRADIDSLENFYARLLVPTAVAILGIAATGLFLQFYDPVLALVAVLGLLFAGFAVPYASWRLGARIGARRVEYDADLRTAIVDGIQGMGEIAAFGGEAQARRRIAELDARSVNAQRYLSKVRGLSEAVSSLAANITLWVGLLVAIPLVRTASLDGAELAMIALFLLAAFESVFPLPQAFALLGSTLTAARRLFEIVDSPLPVLDPANPTVHVSRYDLEFDDVGFSYAAGGNRALKRLSFRVNEGERIAILGSSGSGKTTIVNLLLRFWEYQAGNIRLGGCEIRDFRADDVRSRIAVVSQHSHLFNTTIRENLRIAVPDADQETLERACRIAGIHETITAKPNGYDTLVGEGGIRLSGGEARRLVVARAILRDTPVLVLDEPTEGLDSPTAASLMSMLDKATRGRTVLLITHKAADLAHVDRIVMLEAGTVTDTGTHQELLHRNPAYASLHDTLNTPVQA